MVKIILILLMSLSIHTLCQGQNENLEQLFERWRNEGKEDSIKQWIENVWNSNNIPLDDSTLRINAIIDSIAPTSSCHGDVDFCPHVSCPDTIKMNGHNWINFSSFGYLGRFLFNKYHRTPPGITGIYEVHDSIIYLKKAELCYYDGNYSISSYGTLEIPLGIVLNKPTNDSVIADFMTEEMLLTCMDCNDLPFKWEDRDEFYKKDKFKSSYRYEWRNIKYLYIWKGKILGHYSSSVICPNESDKTGDEYDRLCKWTYDGYDSIFQYNYGKTYGKDHINYDSVYKVNSQSYLDYIKILAPYYQKQRELEKAYRDSVEKIKP